MVIEGPILAKIFGFYPVANYCITSRPWRYFSIEKRMRNDITLDTQRTLCAWRWVSKWVVVFEEANGVWTVPSIVTPREELTISLSPITQRNALEHYLINPFQVHPSRELVASGQKAGRHRKAQPHVRIWSTETLLTLYVFGMTEFQMGVSALAFSQLVTSFSFG